MRQRGLGFRTNISRAGDGSLAKPAEAPDAIRAARPAARTTRFGLRRSDGRVQAC
jgi:hypothetical protein